MPNRIVSANIHETIASEEEGVEWMVLVAALVQKMGGEVVVDVESIEDAVRQKEFVVERNDDGDGITLRVEGYLDLERN